MSAPLLRVFIPSAEGLRWLWQALDSRRNEFRVGLPEDPIGFVCWLTASDSQSFLIGGDAESCDGLFLFNSIVPGDVAFCHVFIWGRDKYAPKDLVAAAQTAAAAVMKAHNLRRLLGMTPTTHAHAKAFAERVGFKVQGRLRNAVDDGGGNYVDAWISDMLAADLEAALNANGVRQ